MRYTRKIPDQDAISRSLVYLKARHDYAMKEKNLESVVYSLETAMDIMDWATAMAIMPVANSVPC
jgi:hypothetical protein